MDFLPYGKNQLFRLVNQSKIGSNIKLKVISNHQHTDSFIGVYNITEKDILLNFNKEEVKQIKEVKIKVKQKFKNLKNLEEDWTTNHKTLMDFYKMTYSDLHGLPKWKQYLYLIPNNNINWDNWMVIGYAIRYCGGNKNDWIEWSKLSEKYLIGSCENFQKFHTSDGQGFGEIKNCYNIYTLRRYAKLSHPAFFKEKKECFESLFDMDLQDINVIEEKSFF